MTRYNATVSCGINGIYYIYSLERTRKGTNWGSGGYCQGPTNTTVCSLARQSRQVLLEFAATVGWRGESLSYHRHWLWHHHGE